jgi:hypothetical protein
LTIQTNRKRSGLMVAELLLLLHFPSQQKETME